MFTKICHPVSSFPLRTVVLGGPVLESPSEYVFTRKNWNDQYFKSKSHNIDGQAILADLNFWTSSKDRLAKAVVDLFENHSSFKQLTVVNRYQETVDYLEVIAPRMKELYERHKTILVYQIDSSAPVLEVTTFSDFLLECWKQCLGHRSVLYWKQWTFSDPPYYGLCSYEDCFPGKYQFPRETLKVIDLQRSDVDDMALKSIAKVEVSISLGGCSLGVQKLKLAENLDSLNYINLERSGITKESAQTIVNLLKMENLQFINIQDTEFSDWLNDHFKEFERLVDEDPRLVSKLIWMPSFEEVFDRCLKNFPDKYIEPIKQSHRSHDLYDKWYDYLSSVDHTAEVLNRLC